MRRAIALLVLVTELLSSIGAHAQGADRHAAQMHFERGVKLTRAGDLEAALSAFQAAYDAEPHFSVLFNVAQAYAGLRQPVRAVEAFTRYLDEGGARIDPERRNRVRELIAQQHRCIGQVALDLRPEGAAVSVDGSRVTWNGSQRTLSLSAGHHVLLAEAPEFLPAVTTVQVVAGVTSQVSLRLEPRPNEAALVNAVCPAPRTEVLVDGIVRGVTPLTAPLLVSPKAKVLEFRRVGYRFSNRPLSLRAGASSTITCNLIQEHQDFSSRVQVLTNVPGARARIDGMPYSGGLLAPGLHELTVTRLGFRPWKGSVDIAAHATQVVRVVLQPTEEFALENEAKRLRHRNWAVALGAGSVALLALGIATYVSNGESYDDWRERQRGASNPALDRESLSQAMQLKTVDAVAVGLAIAGGLAGIGAGAIWATAPPSVQLGARRSSAHR